jgi:hypothetical protein
MVNNSGVVWLVVLAQGLSSEDLTGTDVYTSKKAHSMAFLAASVPHAVGNRSQFLSTGTFP